MKTYKFYKDKDGWFIDLPEWTGDKADLAMVLGADNFLEILSDGNGEVLVTISTEPFENCDELILFRDGIFETVDIGGGFYKLKSYAGIELDLEMWLCDVTKFVFGYLPEKIYFAKQ